jgi:hypothetical protein
VQVFGDERVQKLGSQGYTQVFGACDREVRLPSHPQATPDR